MVLTAKKQASLRESGFTLIETLLVVALLSGIMIVLATIMQEYMRKEHMRSVASQVTIVQRAVNDMMASVEQFGAMYQVVENNGGIAEVSILSPSNTNRTISYAPTAGVNLEMGGAGLKPSNVINAGYNPSGPVTYTTFRDTLSIRAKSYVTGIVGPEPNARQDVRLTVLMRTAGSGGEKALEILIVSLDRLAEREIRDISAHMAADGGFISVVNDADSQCHPSGCYLTARSGFGSWYVDLTNYAGTNWYNIMNSHRADETGGYLVSYSYISERVIAGDYLYRMAIAGSPELNRMNWTLDLGGNNIIGADNVEITNETSTTANPALTVNRAVYAKGSVFVGSNLNVVGDLISDGNIHAGTMGVGPSYDTASVIPPAYGNVNVGGNFNATNADVSNLVSVREAADLRVLSSPEMAAAQTVRATGIDTRAAGGGVTAQAVSVASGQAFVKTQAVASRLTTDNIEAKTAGVVQGELGGGLTVQDRLNLSTSKLTSRGAVTINNLVECKNGC